MDDDRLLTSIAFQGGGALGAYATGAGIHLTTMSD